MSIALITPNAGEACAIYRVAPWRKLGIATETFDGTKGFSMWQAILEHEIALMQRPFTKQQVGIAQTIKDCGRKLIVDWDDDLSCLPPWNPNKKSFDNCEQFLRSLATMADVVTVTTPALAAAAKKWGAKDVRIITNAIDDTFKSLQRLPRNKIILWRGSNTHSADLEEGREYFDRMNATHEIAFVGDAPSWAWKLKHKQYSVLDYCAYMSLMNSLAPEIVAVPLADHPFNHAKSDVGGQEAYAIGAKLWHNGVGVFKGLPEVSEPRWLSTVNHLRSEVIRNLTPTD